MKWLGLLLVTTIWTCINGLASSGNFLSDIFSMFTDSPVQETTSNRSIDNDITGLKAYYDSLTEDLLNSVVSAHGLSAPPGSTGRGRSKRASHSPFTLQDDRGVYRLQGINPLFSVCSQPIDIKMIHFDGNVHVVCVPRPVESGNSSITLGILDEELTQWEQLGMLSSINPQETAVFSDKGNLYIVAADSAKGDGTDLIMYDGHKSQLMTEHTINSKYATAIAVWKMVTDGRYHLAIANSKGPKDSSSFEDETFTYNWMGTYFDKYASFITYDVKDLEPFSIHSSDFIAVANHRVSQSNYHVDSEIFKFDIDSKKWKSFQRIKTYGAMDWEFFSFGKDLVEEHFLAVANMLEQNDIGISYEVNSIIYKFVEDKFVPFQCLQTTGATSITAIRGPRDEFVLAVANNHESVKFYQYNGWHFVEAAVQLTKGSLHVGALSLSHFFPGYGRDVLLSVANPDVPDEEPTVFSLHFEYDNQLGKWHNESLKWCENNRRVLSETDIDSLRERLNQVFFVDQKEPIVIEGNVTLEGDLVINGILTTRRIVNETTVLDHGILHILSQLEEQLNDVKRKIDFIQESLSKALRTSGNQEVTGEYTFDNVEFSCGVEDQCEIGTINTKILNGEDVKDLERSIIWTNIDQSIDIPMEFEHIIVGGDLIVTGLLDGLNTSNLVTKHGNHVITAPKTFVETVHTRDITVHGGINGVAMTPDNIMLTHLDQLITGSIVFSSIEVGSLQVDGLLNGVNLNAFFDDVVTVDGDHIITGAKKINNLIIEKDLNMFPGARLDGVDVIELWNNVLWKFGDQVITAPYNFSSLVLDNLVVTGTINGLRIPEDVLLINENAVITAPKIFSETCSVGELEVLGSLNGLQVIKEDSSEWPNQLDILLKSRFQKVTGHKKFQTLALEGRTTVTGTIDGVNLKELLDMSVLKNATQRLDGTWVFNSDVEFLAPVRVNGLIDGTKLEELYNNALKLDDEIIPENLNLLFTENVKVHSLECRNINGIDTTTDLVTKHTEQVISGTKFFNQIVLNTNVEVRGLINGIDSSFINDTLITVGDQHVRGHKKIEGDVSFKKMVIGGTINGVDTRDFVLLHGNQTITGSKTFTAIEVQGGLRVNNLATSGVIDGVDIKELVENTMTYDGKQVVTGMKTIGGVATVIEGANLATDNLNGVDLSAVWEDAVLVDVPQVISGDKAFHGRVDFDHLWFHSTLDGVTDWDMKENWLLQEIPQVIKGDVIFERDLIIDSDLIIQGSINGVDLVQLNNTVVKIDEPATIEGPVDFLKAVVARGDVTLTGKIQGIDLSEEVVRKTGDATITGHKTIVNGLRIVGNLDVSGQVDGVSVSELCSTTVLRHSNQVISGHTIVNGDVIFESDLITGGLIDGIDITQLNATCLKVNEAAVVKGLKTFNTLTLDGPVTLTGLLGGVNVVNLEQNYMSLTRDQTVKADISFESNLHVQGLVSAGSLSTGSGLVNNVNLQELDDTVLKTHGDQIVTAPYTFVNNVIFESDLKVHGRVDGLRIPEDLMLQNQHNVITAPKVFVNNVEILGNLNIDDGLTVQDVDISQWAEDAVYKTGEFQITGKKTFANLTVDRVTALGKVDNVEISESKILLTYGDQVITGVKTIANDVIIEGDAQIGGLISGVNLTILQEKAMLRGRSNTVIGSKTFTAPIEIGALTTHGAIDSVNIGDLEKAVYEQFGLEEMKKVIDEHQGLIDRMEYLFENQAVCFAYYEEYQALDLPGISTFGHVVTFLGQSKLLVVQSEPQCGLTYIFNYENGIYVRWHEVAASPSAIGYFTVFNSTFVIFANGPQYRYKPPECENDFDDDGKALLYHLTPMGLQLLQALPTTHSTDVEVLLKKDYVCLIFATLPNRDPLQNVFCSSHGDLSRLSGTSFKPVGSRIVDGRKVSIVDSFYGNTTLLAVATYSDKIIYTTSVEIYLWNSKQLKSFGAPIQTIYGTSIQDVLLLEVVMGKEYQILLLVAEGSVAKVGYTPGVTVYRFYHGRPYPFMEYQRISEHEVQAFDWIRTANGDVFVFMRTGESSNNVKVYTLKGASGFVKETTINTKGTQSMLAFNHPGDLNHYVALGSSQCDSKSMYSSPQPEGILLRSKFKGKRLSLH